MKNFLKLTGIVLLILILIFAAYATYVFTSYHRIEDNLDVEVQTPAATPQNLSSQDLSTKNFLLTSWNIGFGAYTDQYSFFMDGGKYSRAFSKEAVISNMNDIASTLDDFHSDFTILQETDIGSTRSYQVDERQMLADVLDKNNDKYWTFAQNYDSPYLFYPLTSPHGKSRSGLMTFSDYQISSALRRSLPVQTDFAKILDLDRCYIINRIPVSDGKELVLINFHLSAYTTDPTIANQQLDLLYSDITKEYKKGNYVICGGDFNKDLLGNSPEIFGVSGEEYSWAQPFQKENLPKHFSLQAPFDAENPVPSCRNADAPWDPETNFQVTLDGFIVSDNVTVSACRVVDTQFRCSDHNPVQLEFQLSK